MFLDSKDIPDLQRLLDPSTGGDLSRIKSANISLSVALFLAIAHRSLWNAGKVTEAGNIARLGLPGVSSAVNLLLAPRAPLSRNPLGAPTFDLFRIQSKDDLRSDAWLLFCDRFRRSADNGRRGKMFTGVAAVLGEMGDNVVWHAFEEEGKPCPAIAGFHVAKGTVSFCVVDAGQGFLKSLRRSIKWAGLKHDQDALNAIVTKGATSRPNENEGCGFKQLFASMLDFNGFVRLRSGTSGMYLANRFSDRELHAESHLHVPGAMVTAVFCGSGTPLEPALEKNC